MLSKVPYTTELAGRQIDWFNVWNTLHRRARILLSGMPDVFDGISSEDLIGEVFLSFLASPDQLGWDPEKGRLESFLAGVLKHKMIDRIRRHSKIAASIDDPSFAQTANHLSVSHQAEEPLVLYDWLDKALHELPSEDLNLISQYYDVDKKHLADQLHISPAALTVRASRVREKIKRNLAARDSLRSRAASSRKNALPIASDDVLRELLEIAHFVLEDQELSIDVVSRALSKFPAAKEAFADNRRTRYRANSKRPSYRPLGNERELLHVLVLDQLDEAEHNAERAGRLQTTSDQIRCFVKQIAKTVLKHNSFYAAVAITKVLGEYPSQNTLMMYDLVAADRAHTKDPSSVSTAKESILRDVMQRFGDRLKLHKEGAAWRLISRKPTDQEIELIRKCLSRFLPSAPHIQFEHLFPSQESNVVESEDLAYIRRFFDITQFNNLAVSVGAKPFEEQLEIPIFDGVVSVDSLSNQTPSPVFDLDQVKSAAAYNYSHYGFVNEDALFAALLAAAKDLQQLHHINQQLAEKLGITPKDVVNLKKRLVRKYGKISLKPSHSKSSEIA